MKDINGQKKVGFAVLGLGIGMAHAEAISTSDVAYLVCGCDIDSKRLEKFSQKYPDAGNRGISADAQFRWQPGAPD